MCRRPRTEVKILYITASLPFSGGEEDFFIPEINALLCAGHQLRIFPRQTNGPPELCAKHLLAFSEVLPLLSFRVIKGAVAEFVEAPFPSLRALWLILSCGKLRDRIKNLAVLPKGLYAGRLAKELGVEHIHAQWAGTTATLALVAHKSSRVPWSFTAHRGDIVQRNLLVEKISSATFVRLISQRGIDLMNKVAPFADRSKFRVIYMGVSVPAFTSAAPQNRSRGPFTIICPAHLIPVKGHVYLIKTLALLKERGVVCRLELAGHGPLRKAIEQVVAELEMQAAVVFLGQVPHDELIERYRTRKVDAVLLPSIDLGHGVHEGIPVSLMEAMAYGIPVVSTTTGGIPELITPGAGILVPPENAPALAEAIESLMSDKEFCARLTVGQWERVNEAFNAYKTAGLLALEMSFLPTRLSLM